MHLRLLSASLALSAAYQLPAPAARGCRRGASPSMGLFDGAKDVFAGDKPIVAADRVTPFDRWLGLDKDLVKADAPKASAVFIDPTDASNYFSVELAKPMGIAFVENDGGSGGIYVLRTTGGECLQLLPQFSAALLGAIAKHLHK